MKRQFIPHEGFLVRKLPKFTFCVLDDAKNNAIYEIAADLASEDRECKVAWFLGNGHPCEFDATLVPAPSACPNSKKPCRQVNVRNVALKDAVEEVRQKMKECMDEVLAAYA